jgi:DNA repair protein RadC
MPIPDWPEGERPREKLIARGAHSLSDAELLAIFLRVGVAGKSAVALARELLQVFGGLHGLVSAERAALTAVKGVGDAKYVQLQATLELARRAIAAPLREANALTSPRAVKDYLRLTLSHLRHEVFHVLYLSAQHHVLADEELFRGSLTQTQVYPRDVAKRALGHNAAAVIVAHNHPDGIAEPSLSDQRMTHDLKSALDLIDVRLVDHFIVAPGAVMSFAERGLL